MLVLPRQIGPNQCDTFSGTSEQPFGNWKHPSNRPCAKIDTTLSNNNGMYGDNPTCEVN